MLNLMIPVGDAVYIGDKIVVRFVSRKPWIIDFNLGRVQFKKTAPGIILIGEHISLRFSERKSQLYLGIVAPPEVKIYREKVYLAIQAEKSAVAAAQRILEDAL